MGDSLVKYASRNIKWGVINRLVSLVMPFIVRSFLINRMGLAYAGLGGLFTSILQVLSLTELGVGSAIVFSMYRPMVEHDDEKICALLALYKRTYQVIGIITLVVGLVFIPFLRVLVKKDVPEDVNIYVLFAVYLINNLLDYFLFSYKQSILIASKRVDLINKIGTVTQLVRVLIQIISITIFIDYYYYVIAIPLSTVIHNIITVLIVHKFYPQYTCRGKIPPKELAEIKKSVGGLVFQKIGDVVLVSVDSMVISAVIGLNALAQYQNYYLIISGLFAILNSIMQSITAVIGTSMVEKNTSENHHLFMVCNHIYVYIVSICTACFACGIQSFIVLWVGEKSILPYHMVILFAIYFFVHKWCDSLHLFLQASGIWWEAKHIPLVSAITNLTLNILLVNIIGLPGIVLSTIIAVVLVYDIGYSMVLHRTYFAGIKSGLKLFWKKQVGYAMTGGCACFISLAICRRIECSNTYISFAISVIVGFAVAILLWNMVWLKKPLYKDSLELLKRIVFRRK